jgi:hypothetical protein
MEDMHTKPKKYSSNITIAILATVVSAGGLFLTGLYRDNPFVISAWKGNDLVTLFVVVPILIAALGFALRGSQRAQLVWIGALDYILYNYAFYLFVSAFNKFFLIYAALLGLSIFALIFGLLSLNVNAIAKRFRTKTPIKWIAGYRNRLECSVFSSVRLALK